MLIYLSCTQPLSQLSVNCRQVGNLSSHSSHGVNETYLLIFPRGRTMESQPQSRRSRFTCSFNGWIAHYALFFFVFTCSSQRPLLAKMHRGMLNSTLLAVVAFLPLFFCHSFPSCLGKAVPRRKFFSPYSVIFFINSGPEFSYRIQWGIENQGPWLYRPHSTLLQTSSTAWEAAVHPDCR